MFGENMLKMKMMTSLMRESHIIRSLTVMLYHLGSCPDFMEAGGMCIADREMIYRLWQELCDSKFLPPFSMFTVINGLWSMGSSCIHICSLFPVMGKWETLALASSGVASSQVLACC